MIVELLIQNGDKAYTPRVLEGITWSTQRMGAPSELNFEVVKDENLNFTEGNKVNLKVDGKNIFCGYVFSKKRDKGKTIKVVAYDQLRYFKNKDTYVYEDKTASEFIKMISDDFGLKTGILEDTGYKIASRIEDNTSLFDMVQTALDLTLQNKKQMYVLYDDFGEITLKSTASMILDIVIDENSAENYDYTSTIDSKTYNKIKLIYDNKNDGDKDARRDVYIAQDGGNIKSWGVLQYFEKLQEGENGEAKVKALLDLYNKKTRTLSISNVFGDTRVRAGCMVYVGLNLGDILLNSLLLVESVKHTFNESHHVMNLSLRGGEFVG